MQPTTTQDARQGSAVESTLPEALSLARALAQRGGDVELQGTVLHRNRALTLAACAAVAAVVTMLGQLAVLPGIALMLAILFSLVRDLEGGSGWLRRVVVLRDIGHNVITWYTPRLPDDTRAPTEPHRPPGPSEVALPGGPTLLVCAPSDGIPGEDRHHRRVHLALLAAVLLSIAGIGLSGTLATIGAGSLALLSAVLTIRHLQSPPRLPSSTIPAMLAILDELKTAPPTNLSLAFAFLEGDSSHHDAVEILLKNFQAALPPERTRVLMLIPDKEALSVQRTEGHLQRRGADNLILQAAAGLSERSGVSGSARVMQLGWRGATLRGDLSQTAIVLKIIRRLDEAAGAGQW